MLRFPKNRWWAFILTLCLFTACFVVLTAQAPSVSYAATPSLNGGTDPPPGYGDPDFPDGGGKTSRRWTVGQGAMGQTVPTDGLRPAGEGVARPSVWMLRFYLVLASLRSLFFRF